MKKRLLVSLMVALLVILGACRTTEEEGPAAGTPLSGFYNAILCAQPEGAEKPALLEETSPEVIEVFYPGLQEIELLQQVYYMHPISTTPCEVMLVEVADAAEVQTVVDLFQKRITQGTEDVAYPENAIGWQKNAQVQQSGNFVCMIVLPDGNVIPEDIFALTPVENYAPTKAPSTAPTEAPTVVQTEAPTVAPTEAPTEVPTATPTAIPTEVPAAAPAITTELSADEETYRTVLEKYRWGLLAQWTAQQYLDAGLSGLAANYGPDTMSEVLVYFLDLDNNGSKELIVGSRKEDELLHGQILDLYTVENGAPKQLLMGSEQSRYYLTRDESGPYEVICEVSRNALVFGWYYYAFIDGELHHTQGIVYDAEVSPEAPWYMTDDADWDVSNDMAVEDFLGQGIVDAGNKRKESFKVEEFTTFEAYR